MNLLQDILVGLATIAALGWLIRQRVRKRKGCADCSLADAVSRSSSRSAQ